MSEKRCICTTQGLIGSYPSILVNDECPIHAACPGKAAPEDYLPNLWALCYLPEGNWRVEEEPEKLPRFKGEYPALYVAFARIQKLIEQAKADGYFSVDIEALEALGKGEKS